MGRERPGAQADRKAAGLPGRPGVVLDSRGQYKDAATGAAVKSTCPTSLRRRPAGGGRDGGQRPAVGRPRRQGGHGGELHQVDPRRLARDAHRRPAAGSSARRGPEATMTETLRAPSAADPAPEPSGSAGPRERASPARPARPRRRRVRPRLPGRRRPDPGDPRRGRDVPAGAGPARPHRDGGEAALRQHASRARCPSRSAPCVLGVPRCPRCPCRSGSPCSSRTTRRAGWRP